MTDRDKKLAELVARTKEAERDPAVKEAHAHTSREVAANVQAFTDLDQER
jgi:hypothetical protein